MQPLADFDPARSSIWVPAVQEASKRRTKPVAIARSLAEPSLLSCMRELVIWVAFMAARFPHPISVVNCRKRRGAEPPMRSAPTHKAPLRRPLCRTRNATRPHGPKSQQSIEDPMQSCTHLRIAANLRCPGRTFRLDTLTHQYKCAAQSAE